MKVQVVIITFVCTLFAAAAYGEHPIDVARASANGDYFDALVIWNKLPKRRATTESIMAAAKSAWALGLGEKASELYDFAAHRPDSSARTRALATLSRGIIEFQESNYQLAVLFAERAIKEADEKHSDMVAKAEVLLGDSEKELDSLAGAEKHFLKALKLAPHDESYSVNFKLGEVQQRLGKLDEAAANFKEIPLNHELIVDAIKHLATIASEEKNYKETFFWLKYGRENYPEKFLSSWVDYALFNASIRLGKESEKIFNAAVKRYPPSDPWLILLNAEHELHAWSSGTTNGDEENS